MVLSHNMCHSCLITKFKVKAQNVLCMYVIVLCNTSPIIDNEVRDCGSQTSPSKTCMCSYYTIKLYHDFTDIKSKS